MTYPLEPDWVTILHLNMKVTDALLVILEREYAGRFTLRICQTHYESKTVALVEIIDCITGMQSSQTGIKVACPAENLVIVQETWVENEWHAECMKTCRQQARTH